MSKNKLIDPKATKYCILCPFPFRYNHRSPLALKAEIANVY